MSHSLRMLFVSIISLFYFFAPCGVSAEVKDSRPADGLVIYAAEIGIGKFHRHDDAIHHYDDTNVWKNFVLPPGASNKTPLVLEHADHSLTIYFSHLEELLQTARREAIARGRLIQVLNVSAHGMPGGMWYPKDAAEQASDACLEWRHSAQASDEENYNDYYQPISKREILEMRAASREEADYECVTNANGWRTVAMRIPDLKNYFTADAQIHFLSCLVGLGPVGDRFGRGVAEVLLHDPRGRVESSLMYGLGDWSLPEGMGFWDYVNDKQLDYDNEHYPVDRRDRDEMQKGTTRVSTLNTAGVSRSGVIESADFMYLDLDMRAPNFAEINFDASTHKRAPHALRIPGTHVRALRIRR